MLHIIFFRKYHQKKVEKNGRKNISYDPCGKGKTWKRIRRIEISEYEAAKDEQAFVEGQISSLETKIRYAEIVNSDSVAQDEVAIGKTVTIQEIGEDEEEVYIIVGSAGADAFAGKVSNESPIGQALIGKKTGDTATIETPVGSYDVKILKVEKTA